MMYFSCKMQLKRAIRTIHSIRTVVSLKEVVSAGPEHLLSSRLETQKSSLKTLSFM